MTLCARYMGVAATGVTGVAVASQLWRILGGTIVDQDSRDTRRLQWGSWMAKSHL